MWSEYTLGWLAALIDGEGSVMLNTHRSTNGRGRGYSLRPVVIVANNNRDLIDAIVNRTGIDRVYSHKRTARESLTKHDTFTWRMSATEIREYGPALLPHLIVKRPQMELLLEALSLTGKGPVATGWDRRLEIQAEIRRLNKPGKERPDES